MTGCRLVSGFSHLPPRLTFAPFTVTPPHPHLSATTNGHTPPSAPPVTRPEPARHIAPEELSPQVNALHTALQAAFAARLQA